MHAEVLVCKAIGTDRYCIDIAAATAVVNTNVIVNDTVVVVIVMLHAANVSILPDELSK
jgi:hypothetical protein